MRIIKDDSILQLIENLTSCYGIKAFQIKDYWQGDLCAIGITNSSGKHLFYISSFKKNNEKFDITL